MDENNASIASNKWNHFKRIRNEELDLTTIWFIRLIIVAMIGFTIAFSLQAITQIALISHLMS